MNKFSNFLIVFSLVLLIGIFIFLFSTMVLVFDLDFYKEQGLKTGVYSGFENASYVDGAYSNLLDHFNNNQDLLEIYSQEEVIHLSDIRNILNGFKILFYLLFLVLFLLVFLLFKIKYKYLWLVFVCSFLVVILFSLFLYIFSTLNFERLFTGFHLISFDNNYWMLEENSTLIRLFPERFFINSLSRILLNSFLLGLFCIIIGLYLRKSNLNYR